MQLPTLVSWNLVWLLLGPPAVSATPSQKAVNGSSEINLDEKGSIDGNHVTSLDSYHSGTARFCSDDAFEIGTFKYDQIRPRACKDFLSALVDTKFGEPGQGTAGLGCTQAFPIQYREHGDKYGCKRGTGFIITVRDCKKSFTSYMGGWNRDLANPGSKGSKCPGILEYHDA